MQELDLDALARLIFQLGCKEACGRPLQVKHVDSQSTMKYRPRQLKHNLFDLTKFNLSFTGMALKLLQEDI